jgi:DedD protein
LTRGYFDDEEATGEEPEKRERDHRSGRSDGRAYDTELTLSTAAQLGVIFGLLVLCALCFGLGYAVGHRGGSVAVPATATQPASPTATPDQEPLQGNGSLPKPSADAQAPLPQGPPESDATAPPADDGGANPAKTQPEPAANVPTTPPTKSPASAPATPPPAQPPTQVRVPFPTPENAPRSGQRQDAPPVSASRAPAAPAPASRAPAAPAPLAPTPVSPIRPAFAGASNQSAGQFMVQVAAVSHGEDAAVLVGALRKRGYAASAQRQPSDGLIHVRIGPFATHDEAYRMSARLLGDGYNAIVQP